MKQLLRLPPALLLLAMLASPAAARDDGAPASALAEGDAVRATATGASGLYFNPAGIQLIRQYALSAGYTYLNDLESHGISASAVDTATNEYLGMGSAYTFVISSGKEKREGHMVRAAVGTGYRGESFGIHLGVGTNYTTMDVKGVERYGSLRSIEYFTLDAGAVLSIADMFRIGVSAQNLLSTKQGSSGILPAPRTIGLGAALSIDAFQIAFDAVLDIETDAKTLPMSYHIGAHYLIEGMVVVRLGFKIDQGIDYTVQARGRDDYVIAGGVGYVSREFGVDVGFQKSVIGDDGTIVSANFQYFLP